MRELRRRNIVRTANNPVADIAEELVAIHYKGRRGSFSQLGGDVGHLLPATSAVKATPCSPVYSSR